jgi:S1-C subfamily serine protease
LTRTNESRPAPGSASADRGAGPQTARAALFAAVVVSLAAFSSALADIQRVPAPRGALNSAERAVAELFERVSPSVVQVAGRSAAASVFDEDRSGINSGTGFVWDERGHIVTNEHVVRGVSAVAVRFASGRTVGAEIVGTAPNHDLAVLRVKGLKTLPRPVAVGTSHDLKVGQFAYAIGNPFGLSQSLTSGIISALQRRLPTESGREIANVIQTDAAINPGNSGGPLLDSAGRVIGVTTAILSPSGSNAGVGFAIPIDVVNRVVSELIARGRVAVPGIGIVAASETLAARLGIEGVIVVQVASGSPADRSGLLGVDLNAGTLGDVIVAVNGKPVRRLADLTDALEQAGIGRNVQLSVVRGGRTRSVEVAVVDLNRS